MVENGYDKNMKYGIASYHRPKCRTVTTLLNEGVQPSDILISTQTKGDYEQYKKSYQDKGTTVLFREATNSAANRNTILMNCAERPIVLLDDDITSFVLGNRTENFRKRKNGEAIAIIQEISKLHFDLIGCSETTSNLYKRKRLPISTNVLLQGSFLIVNSTQLFFNEQYEMLVDYELTLRAIKNGFNVARYNYLGTNKPKNGTNTGGITSVMLAERIKNGCGSFKTNTATLR